MTKTIYDLTKDELFRLICAYSAIRNPTIRAEFLRCIEAWAQDQGICLIADKRMRQITPKTRFWRQRCAV